MPRDIPVYSKCAGPGVAGSWKQMGGVAELIARLFMANPWVTGGVILAWLIGFTLLNSPATWVITILVLITGLQEFKDWYYNHRLLCIRDRDCAIGTVITEPKTNFDGDRKLNLMLVPFSRCDWITAARNHIEANRGMLTDDANFQNPPFHTAAPALPTANELTNFDTLKEYLKKLKSKNPDEFPDDSEATSDMYRQFLVGLVNRVLKADPQKSFYNQFYRKDPAEIGMGSATWVAIPEDFDTDPAVNWDGPNAQSLKTHYDPYLERVDRLNPMFRYDVDDHLVSYLHGEIEGYRIQLLVDNLILALLAFLAAVIALSFLGPISGLLALLIALFVYWFKNAIDWVTGNDGDAGSPDVGWDEPGTPGDGAPQRKGDVVLMYGNHIMDTDHYEYFEIHPIRAYYLLSHDPTMATPGDPTTTPEGCDETKFSNENVLQTLVDQNFADFACALAATAEEEPPPVILERTGPTLLSYGMTTHYAGGGAQRPVA